MLPEKLHIKQIKNMKTAEEFVREKIRSKYGVKGEMKALHTYSLNGEDALRWAHEFHSQNKEKRCNCQCK